MTYSVDSLNVCSSASRAVALADMGGVKPIASPDWRSRLNQVRVDDRPSRQGSSVRKHAT